MARSLVRSCPIVERKKFLMSFNLLNERSLEATVTGIEAKIRNAITIFLKSSPSFISEILFNKSNGARGSFPKFAV